MPSIPDELDTPGFRKAWRDWLGYRREKRKPVSTRAANMQLRRLAACGPAAAVAAIEMSIGNDWQGLFPGKMADVGKRGRHVDGVYMGNLDDLPDASPELAKELVAEAYGQERAQ